MTAIICMSKYGNLQLLKLQLPLQQTHLHLNQTNTVVKVGPVQGCCCPVFQLDLNDILKEGHIIFSGSDGKNHQRYT